jgi:TatD DNase family protein
MTFIDTHSHIYAKEFDSDIGAVIERALQSKVEKILLPSIDRDRFKTMSDLVSAYPSVVFPMIGLHPSSVKDDVQQQLQLVQDELKTGKYCAMGEVGIDLYWDKTRLREQCEAFGIQLQLAMEYSLPVVIHQRESFFEIMDILDQAEFRSLNGVFHCFAGDVDMAKKCIDLGFILGIGGVVTYKNSLMAEVVKSIPLEYLVLETDAPYLTPVPYRGKRNEPSYIPLIAERVANIKSCNIEEVASQTTSNAMQLFFKN